LELSRAADYDATSTVPVQSAAPAAAAAPEAGLQEVVIVYKTHFDIGYTARAREVIHEYRTLMADRVVDVIEKYRNEPKEKQFVWTLSGYPMQEILWEGQDPARRAKIEQAIRDGNLAIHAYPGTTHTETMEPEDIVRGLGISSAINRTYGRPLSTSAKMSDVPGNSWIFPTIFTHAGMKFYHMGGPLVNKTLGLPPMFWWEGPDGSRLLTLYNNGYGTSALPPGDWPYRSWVNISMTGDNQGPPDPGTVARDLAWYAQRGIKARVGRMDDFAELILKEDLSALPVVRSDIPDPWIHGAMSMPEAAKQAMNVRPRIGALDALITLQKAWGLFRPDVSKAVAKAYEQSFLYSEHTWGLANQHYIRTPYGQAWHDLWAQGLPPQYQKIEASWKDHADYVDHIDRLTAEPYDEALTALADSVNVGGGRIVVYNPLPWKRDGEVTINCFHLPHGASLKPADGGPALPYVLENPTIEDQTRTRRFVVRDIPPMGYRTFVVSGEKPEAAVLTADAAAGTIESPFFKAALDPKRGRIVSLVDKRSGRELVDPAAPQGFGQYLYERFGRKDLHDWTAASLYGQYNAHKMIFSAYDIPADSVYTSALPENLALSVRQTAIDVSAVMTGSIPGPGEPQRVSIRLTLSGLQPVADLEVSWQKQPDSWPEAGWICLPFNVSSPRFRLGKVGADLDPVKDWIVPNANYHNTWVNTGVAVYDGQTGAGVGLCPMDTPHVSLGEPGEYKFEARYEPKKPYVYLNLYNNHWRTNFRAYIGDGRRLSARVRLWTFDAFDSEAALYTPAMEARVPLAAGRSTARAGALPPTRTGVQLSRKGVAVTAFGPNPDGAGTVLRLWEQGGKSGDVAVTLPPVFKTATPVNLRGEKAGPPVTVADGTLGVALRAYAPASYVLEP
jgi:hypothetical protein